MMQVEAGVSSISSIDTASATPVPCACRRTATMAASSMAEPEPLPVDPLEMVAQAARSIQRYEKPVLLAMLL